MDRLLFHLINFLILFDPLHFSHVIPLLLAHLVLIVQSLSQRTSLLLLGTLSVHIVQILIEGLGIFQHFKNLLLRPPFLSSDLIDLLCCISIIIVSTIVLINALSHDIL
jgi:hypothetical protein